MRLQAEHGLGVRLYGHSGVGIGPLVEMGVQRPARHGEGLAVACKGRELLDVFIILPVGIGKEVALDRKSVV